MIEVLGCIQELALFSSAVWLTWGLQVSTGKKASVLLAFSCRLL